MRLLVEGVGSTPLGLARLPKKLGHSRVKITTVQFCVTYIKCPVGENPVRNADRSVAVVTAHSNNAVSFVCAERKENCRQRAVS